jgi:hypothetical protein
MESFVPIDDTAGDLAAVEDLSSSSSSSVRPSTPTKLGQSSWWRTSIANLRRPRGEEKEDGGAAGEEAEKKKTRAGLDNKRFATVQPLAPRGTETRRKTPATTASSPDLTTPEPSATTLTTKKKEKKRSQKNESESESEKSEAAVGKAAKSEGSEVKPAPAAGHGAKKKKSKEERLQKSRSLSVIGQVAEEMEQRSSSKELDAVEEELKGPLPVRPDMSDRQRKRHQVINEIVNTERAYVRDLQVLLAVFVYFVLPTPSAHVIAHVQPHTLMTAHA